MATKAKRKVAKKAARAPHIPTRTRTRDAGSRKWKPSKEQSAFLEKLAKWGTISKAATESGVGRRTHYDWMADEDYQKASQDACDEFTDRIEAEAFRIAEHGTDNAQARMIELVLTGRRKSVYSKRTEVTGKDGETFGGKEPTDTAVAATIVGIIRRFTD